MKSRLLLVFALLGLEFFFSAQAVPQRNEMVSRSGGVERLGLARATMCEAVRDGKPANGAVVFSTDRERVSCFTAFDPVPEETQVYHNWFHRDESVARIKLRLKPPRWSTYSSIQLRESDRGPWRVEIVNEQGRRLETLRFSITD